MKLFSKTEPTPEQIEELERAFTADPEPDPDGVVLSMDRERRRIEAGKRRNAAANRLREYRENCAICGTAELGKNPPMITRESPGPWLREDKPGTGSLTITLCRDDVAHYRNTRVAEWTTAHWHEVCRKSLAPVRPELVAYIPDGEYGPSILSDRSWLSAAIRARRAGLEDPGTGEPWSHL